MKNDKEYMRKYMSEYRKGKRRSVENEKIRDKIKQDRINGEDIYTIGVRYGYRPESIARLCQNLPIKKHVNRHKLFWGYTNKCG